MWDLGSRDIVALASAFTGCVFLYNVWGPILILTVSLFLTVYACYSLIVNDSLLSPHAFLLLDYCRHVCAEIRVNFEGIVDHAYEYIHQFLVATKRRVQKQYLTLSRMERRRGSHYQLSSDSYSNRREPSSSKNRFQKSSHASLYDRGPFEKHTSTPIYPRRKEEFENQTFDLSLPDQTLGKGISSPRSLSGDLFRQQNALYLAAESSLWGVRAASKGEKKFAEEKSTDTHSGPLSSSTRYNMDPKVYNDVTSPGLTSRLTKYAAEASNKLTHQSQYRVGQFPKVNLHASPVPLLNAKSVKTRTPVTVRVAPPDVVRYSPPSRQKRFTDLHWSINDYTSPNVAQALKDISLKRHASRENIASDIAKKQRTDGLARKEAEMQEEAKQKRGREESLKSEEETSPQSKSARPAKRTKTPSCYDIINSLSSSKHVVSGVKRKARDFSRSGTPDFEKHFKSVECGQSADTPTVQQVQGTSPKHHHHRRYEKIAGRKSNSNACNCTETVQQEDSPLRGILKNNDKVQEAVSEDRYLCRNEPKTRCDEKDRAGPAESARLAQKLFMKAEPERNEKLHMLVEEQGNIRAKFTTDDVEEIKKEDIADMRQTSMKARLQSMFDAISGKAASRINPDVVIQAEEVSNAVESVACPVTCATLNSSTVTTNVNTTPISTSAVAPSPRTSESNVKSPKHVAFNLPDKESSSNTNVQQIIDSSRLKSENGPPSATSSATGVSVPSFTVAPGIVSQPTLSSTTTSAPASTNTNGQNVEFGKSTFAISSANGTIGNKSSAFAVSTNANTFEKVAATSTPSAPSPSAKMTVANVSQAPSIASSNSNLTMGGSSRIFATSNANANAARLNAPPVPESKAGSAAAGSVPPVCPGNVKTETSATSMKISASSALPPGPPSVTNTATGSAPLFVFRNGNGAAKNTKSDAVFAFDSSAGNTPQSSGLFGPSTTLQPMTTAVGPGLQTNPAPSTTATGTFGQIGKTTSSGFGPSPSSTFTFRGAAATTASDGKATFSFGNTSNAPIASNAPAAASNASVFPGGKAGPATSFAAQSAAASTGSSPGQFGSNAASMFASSTTAPSIFGATATGSQAIFGASSNNSKTSATSASAFPLPKSTPSIAFGSNVPATSANSAPLFSNSGNVSAPGTTSSASMSVFGSNASTAAPGKSGNVTTSGSLFSGASLSTTPSSAFAAPSSIFGQANPPAVGANCRNDTGVFGSSSGPTLFGSQANSLSTFDAAKVPTSSATAAFGSSSVAPSNGPVPSFGTASTTASGFGSQPKTEPGVQGAGSQPFAIGTSIFGTENTGAASFGRVASTIGAGPFGTPTTSNAFAGQSANSTFGGGGTLAGAFGDTNKASPFGGQAAAFGPANASNPAAFGSGGSGGGSNANNENNTGAGMFTFGANQKPAPPQTSTFSFGGNNNAGNNPAGASSAPFQFGTTASSGSGTGFNFSAPPAAPSINFGTTNAPSTFNPSTPGMFSIGSGSNAPRSRSMRTRKPR